MADNTELNPGTGGDVIASDDISGVKYQRIKLVHGADGTSAGDVAAGNPLPVRASFPFATSGTIMSAQTNATGTSWTAFASQACVALDIVNNTGTTVEYRRGATGTAMQIATGSARLVIGITNANQIDIRRTDTSNTQVTVQAEAFGL